MTTVPTRALSVAAALWLGPLAAPSVAQGTAAQREACAPDAIRLCQDAIPDVPKTAACMRAHLSELSPSCRSQFVASKEGSSHRRTARAERAAPAQSTLGLGLDFGQLPLPDDEADTPASRARDAREARRVVASLCRNGILGADACRLTNTALDLAR